MNEVNNKPLHISEQFKNWTQVVAWILAGAWTFWIFSQTQLPFLETRGAAQSTVKWSPRPSDPTACQANFEVTVGNIGNRPFDVVGVRIRRWNYKKPAFQGTSLFLDTQKVQLTRPDFEQEFQSGTLVRHYAPGQAASDTFIWLLQRDTNSLAVFRADFRTKKEADLLSPTYYWEDTCGSAQPAGTSRKVSSRDHASLGSSYVMQGRYDEAIAEFDASLKLNPDLVEAYFNRGVAYSEVGGQKAKAGDFAGARLAFNHAIEDYSHVLKLNPRYSMAENFRKQVLQEVLSLSSH